MNWLRVGLLVWFVGWVAPALGAVTPNSPVTPQTPNAGTVTFTSGSSPGTYVTLYTGGANASDCFAGWVSNNDTATHLLTFQVVNSTVKYGGPTLTTTAAGTSGTFGTPQSFMTSGVWPGLGIDLQQNPFLYLRSGDTLQVTFATSITSGDVVDVEVQCADF